jgi:hypothetical protein
VIGDGQEALSATNDAIAYSSASCAVSTAARCPWANCSASGDPSRVRIPLVLFELASRLIAFHLRDVASGARRKPAEVLKRPHARAAFTAGTARKTSVPNSVSASSPAPLGFTHRAWPGLCSGQGRGDQSATWHRAAPREFRPRLCGAGHRHSSPDSTPHPQFRAAAV